MDFKKIMIGLNVIVFLAIIINYTNQKDLKEKDELVKFLTEDVYNQQIEDDISETLMEAPKAPETPETQIETPENQEETPEAQIEFSKKQLKEPVSSSLESYVNQILDYEFENTVDLLSGFDDARKSLNNNEYINPQDRHQDGYVRFKDLYTEEVRKSLHHLQYLAIQYYSVEYDQLIAFYMEPVYTDILLYNNTHKKEVSPEYYVIYAPDGILQVENFIEYLEYAAFYPKEYQRNKAFYKELNLFYPKIKKLNDNGWYFVFLDKVLVQ